LAPRSPDDDDCYLRGLGGRLRATRAERGMTRRALSRQCGVSERYLAQLEAGGANVSVVLLRGIAGALGVSPARLLETGPAPAPPTSRRHRIALIGLRGAGKSTLGSRLAEMQGCRFIELDREIERDAGLELREIFEQQGQAGFRALERRALARLLDLPGAVIATGGSIVADPETYAALRQGCLTVWLRAAPEEHMQRVIAQGDLRPMQDRRAAMADLRAILASREPLYAQADLVLDTSGRELERSFAELQRLVAGPG